MRHLKPVSLIAVVAMLGVFSFHAFLAITTTFDYNTPADFTLDTDYNQEITDGELVLGEQYEIQINDTIDGNEYSPFLLPLDNGNLLHILGTIDLDEDGNDDTVVKITDEFGRTVVPETKIHTYSDGRVAPLMLNKLANGNIFVTLDYLGTTSELYGLIVDQDLNTVVNEFAIDELTDGTQSLVRAISTGSGNVVVTWRSGDTSDPADTVGDHVAAKIYDQDGNVVKSEFVVNQDENATILFPVTQFLEGDNVSEDRVLITWEEGSGPYNIKGRLYDADGTALGNEFILVSGIDGTTDSRLVKTASNQYMYFYEEFNGDADGYGINVKLIDQNGADLTSAILVNEEIEGWQTDPRPIVLSNGNVFVVWETDDINHDGPDDDDEHIAGKVYRVEDNSGLEIVTVVPEFQVNVDPTARQRMRDIIIDSGNIYVTYAGYGAARYGTDLGRHAAMLVMKEDFSFYKDVYSPSSTLSSGVLMDESLRQVVVEYGSGNEGDVSMQISNDDGATWFYFDGGAWVETTAGVDESNSQNVANANLNNFYSDQGLGGTFNVKLFLNSDGTEEVIVDTLSILENEVAIIGNDVDSIDIDVEENETRVGQYVDPEGDEVTYQIVGGSDQSLFTVSESGLLSISLDGDLGETYEVVVRSTDEFGGVNDQTVNVTVVRVAPSNGSSSGGSISNPFGGTLTVDSGTEMETEDEGTTVEVQEGLFYNLFFRSLRFDFTGFLYDLFN